MATIHWLLQGRIEEGRNSLGSRQRMARRLGTAKTDQRAMETIYENGKEISRKEFSTASGRVTLTNETIFGNFSIY